MPLTFEEAEDYLNRAGLFCVKPSLERIRLLCAKLGNPQLEYPSIHITGTNGKTSVACMVASILEETGRRVGRFTSPHLHSVRERIVVNGRPISEREFASLTERIIPYAEETNRETGDPLTYFELNTAQAFLYFSERKVDVAVVEVGMGGRWDATNVIPSRVQVITTVGLDHVVELGGTLESIAREKAGIIKEDGAVICGVREEGLRRIIEEEAENRGARVFQLGRDFHLIYRLSYGLDSGRVGQVVGIRGLLREYGELFLPLLGEHQAANAACAVAASEAFFGHPRNLPAQEVERGLSKARNPGRLEVASFHPLVILDGAHNPQGAERLAQTLTSDLDYRRLILVLGFMEDKDIDGILAPLLPLASEVVVTRSSTSRSADPRILAGKIGGRKPVHVVDSVPEAVKLAKSLASVDDAVCVTGSLYLVGEAREALGLRW